MEGYHVLFEGVGHYPNQEDDRNEESETEEELSLVLAHRLRDDYSYV